MSFKIEVDTGENTWSGNELRFATRDESEAYGRDLYSRWMAVRDVRTVESTDPANYTFGADGLVRL